MSEELKPCPFCGGEARISEVWDGAIVYCKNFNGTHIIEVAASDKASAIEAWNTRAGDPVAYADLLNRAAGKWAHADYENRELREIIQVLYALTKCQCAQYEDDDHCRACDLWPMMSERCDLKLVEDRMEKLGIEVKI